MSADRSAFERFYERNFTAVVRTAYLLTGDTEEAVDLAQETFVRAYEHWRSVSGHPEPAAWLQRVVSNLALSWRRRQQVRKRVRVPPPQGATEPSDPLEPIVVTGLLALTPEQRVVIVLRFMCDQSVTQVAESLGKREGTVRALTSQGLSRLRKEIELEMLTS